MIASGIVRGGAVAVQGGTERGGMRLRSSRRVGRLLIGGTLTLVGASLMALVWMRTWEHSFIPSFIAVTVFVVGLQIVWPQGQRR